MKFPHIFPTPRPLHLWLASLALLLSACSTTSHLPEDEQLYIGIDHISYDGTPLSSKHKAKQDSAGVITSIGNAVEAVGDVLRGNGTKALEEQMKAPEKRKLSAEERRAEKKRREAEQAAFATAKEEVEAVLAYPPNYALFGSSSMRSPFPVGLWVYNGFVDHQEGLGKWIFKTFAATPVYVSTVSPEVRARVAANTLHNYGFFSGRVNSEVLPQRNPRKAKVAYSVYAGPLHRLDSIAYLNFPARADSLLRATEGQRLLRKGDAFSVVNLSNEQTRIENLFRETATTIILQPTPPTVPTPSCGLVSFSCVWPPWQIVLNACAINGTWATRISVCAAQTSTSSTSRCKAAPSPLIILARKCRFVPLCGSALSAIAKANSFA